MGEKGSEGGSRSSPVHPMFLSKLSPSADLAVAIFLVFTGVTSMLGNGVVLFVNCRKRKKLRPPELMTINLALCDFGFSVLGMPFFITSSLCHAWVFGETGCLWYGIQGFVFGIGSLLTTCLISVDRCLKICCLRYGQWIEKRHLLLSIALVWVYTTFWASLPAFGFGSYGPEPYGTSCTIDWWRMRSSLNDRIYIFLVLTLCFGFPTLTIVTSYLAIFLTVHRSNRTLASIPSSSVSNTSKDLRLAKMAAVVFATFLLAWLPYATVSLISTLAPRDDREAERALQTVADEFSGVNSSSPVAPKIPDIPSLFNWTATAYHRQIYSNPERVNNVAQPPSCLPPMVTLIPAMFAKSHCMINPLIYQIMNREFRDEVFLMLFGQHNAEKRLAKRRKGSLRERSISLSSCYSVRMRRRSPATLCAESINSSMEEQRDQRSDSRGGIDSLVGNEALEIKALDSQGNTERHSSITVHSQIDTLVQ